MRAYRDFIEAAPDEIGGGALYLTGPAEDFVPEHLVGELTLAMLVTYAGAEASARTSMAPSGRAAGRSTPSRGGGRPGASTRGDR